MATNEEWARQNYDVNGNCVIGLSELNQATQDNMAGKITNDQLDTIAVLFRNQTALCPQSSPLAKGSIVNFSYPTNAKNNERIGIRAAIKNTGGSLGTFKLQLFRGSSRVAQSTSQTIQAGSTGAAKTMSVTTPGTGNAIDYQIKCVRVT